MSQLIDFQDLRNRALELVTHDNGVREQQRENEMRESCYGRWAKSKPNEARNYKNQYICGYHNELILRYMTPEEYKRIKARAVQGEKDKKAEQGAMF